MRGSCLARGALWIGWGESASGFRLSGFGKTWLSGVSLLAETRELKPEVCSPIAYLLLLLPRDAMRPTLQILEPSGPALPVAD